MVGRHVSSMPEETSKMLKDNITLALKEYEITIVEWIKSIEESRPLSSVKGLAFNDKPGEPLILTEERPPLENLDELPWVTPIYKEFLNIEDYYYGHSLHPLVVLILVEAAHKCTFCVYPQTFSGHTMRYRSESDVAAEFQYVASELPQVKTIMLEDDTFPVDEREHRLM